MMTLNPDGEITPTAADTVDFIHLPNTRHRALRQPASRTAPAFVLTNGIDVKTPGYSEIKITFSYKAVSMDNSREGFMLDYWDGKEWVTLKSWFRYIDFSNIRTYYETVEISTSNVTFPADMKIRFVCDASSNTDIAMIDEIAISAR
jgi:hypothetical protein